MVEDLSEDNLEDFNNTLEVPESPKKGFKISSSDLDFLDQIVTSSSKSPEIQTGSSSISSLTPQIRCFIFFIYRVSSYDLNSFKS